MITVKEQSVDKQRHSSIDFLRILFVVMIVYYHFIKASYVQVYDIPLFDDLKNGISHCGRMCNAFLFILSGFFLYISFIKRKDNNIASFIVKKIIRFWPPMIFAILCGVVLDLFHLINFDLSQNVLFLCFISKIGVGLSTDLAYLNVLWFISALFWCSVFYYSFLCLCSEKWYMFFIGLFTYVNLLIYINCGLGPDTETIFSFIPPSLCLALSCIGLGIVLCKIYRDYIVNLKINWFVASVIEVYILFYLVNGLLFNPFHIQFIAIIILFIVLLILLLLKQGLISQLLDNPVFSLIGRYAFSIYIMQHIVFVFYWKVLWAQKDFVLSNPITAIVFSLVVAIVVGVATFHYIERPATSFIKRIIKNQ